MFNVSDEICISNETEDQYHSFHFGFLIQFIQCEWKCDWSLIDTLIKKFGIFPTLKIGNPVRTKRLVTTADIKKYTFDQPLIIRLDHFNQEV